MSATGDTPNRPMTLPEKVWERHVVHRAPDGATVTAESLLKNVLPFNMMAMAMGLHPRCGIEDTIIGQHGQRMTSVEQIQQCVRVAHELGREVASGKEARAIYKIGALTQAGDGIDQDYARAMELFQQAAEAGEPLGYNGIGQLYQNGQGVGQDYGKAAAAYQQGADQGEPQSEAALAYLYEQGLGVEQDYGKSFALLTDSAAQGYGFGQAALAIHYLFGQGVASDPGKALSLALQAVDKHVNYANGIVGYMYAEGLGTARDLGAAQMYYQAGSDGGDQYSADRLKITELEITCEDAAGSQYEPGGVGHGVDFEAIDADAAIAACSAAVEANPESVGDQAWLARAYMKDSARISANRPALTRHVPNELRVLADLHRELQARLKTNMTVLATAHAVSEDIIRGVAGEMQRKASPSTYGASGRTSQPSPRTAQPLAVSRSI